MKPLLVLALVLAVPIGLTLGAVGAGGSILTLPVLVYVLRVPAAKAVPMSMVVVAGTSLVAAVLHYRRGLFHTRAFGLFAATGVPGAFLGSYLTHLVSQRVLLGIFALLMLGAGAAMLQSRGQTTGVGPCRTGRCLAIGAGVGVLTGFLGVGGGFMIVPALVLLAGVGAKEAVGSSLAIITLNSVAGLAGQIRQVSFDWTLALGFLALALAGMLAGVAVAERVPASTLRKGFGELVVLVGLVIGGLAAAGVSLPSG